MQEEPMIGERKGEVQSQGLHRYAWRGVRFGTTDSTRVEKMVLKKEVISISGYELREKVRIAGIQRLGKARDRGEGISMCEWKRSVIKIGI